MVKRPPITGPISGALRGLGLMSALALAGCGLFDGGGADSALGCPQTYIVGEVSMVSRPDAPDAPAYNGEIVGISGDCAYDGDAVDVDLDLVIVYDRRPGMPERLAYEDFFVAVARPDGAVIGKEVFQSEIAFNENENRMGVRESIHEHIPLPEGAETGRRFTIYAGFQLNRDELEQARARRAALGAAPAPQIIGQD